MECVENWAARLAQGPDDARTIAEAVSSACADGVQAENDLHLKEYKRPIDVAERERSLQRHALFIAVQTRAGNCGFPK